MRAHVCTHNNSPAEIGSLWRITVTRIQTLPPVWRPLWSPAGFPYHPKECRETESFGCKWKNKEVNKKHKVNKCVHIMEYIFMYYFHFKRQSCLSFPSFLESAHWYSGFQPSPARLTGVLRQYTKQTTYHLHIISETVPLIQVQNKVRKVS